MKDYGGVCYYVMAVGSTSDYWKAWCYHYLFIAHMLIWERVDVLVGPANQ